MLVRKFTLGAGVVGLAMIVASGAGQPATPSAPPQTAQLQPSELSLPASSDTKATDLPGLHNIVAFAPNLYSGSAPEGEAGFDTLKRLGIRTIISVDGAQPEVERAKARGMRYIHLPIGYNGMERGRTLEIARAIELGLARGPVYLHCHHGKHRSAGATGAAAVTLGLLNVEEAGAKMRVSGTAPNYVGLFRCVEVAERASRAELDSVKDEFPERWKTSGLVNTMVEIDEVFDHLKLIEKAGWDAPKEHPDLVPAAEAGRLADLFRNLEDGEQLKSKPVEVRRWMETASKEAAAVESSIVEGKTASEISSLFKAVTQSCKECHAKYRD